MSQDREVTYGKFCNAAASRKYSKDFDSPLSESMVGSLRKTYTAALEAKKHCITEITADLAL